MLAASTPRTTTTRRPIGRLALVLLAAAALLLAAVSVAAAVSYVWPDAPWPPTETIIIGSTADFEPGSVTQIRDDERQLFGWLVHLEDGEFIAFDRRDPVWGCTLPWRPAYDAFKDPCHGSSYDVTGQPSPENGVRLPMNRLDLQIDLYGTLRVITVNEEAR